MADFYSILATTATRLLRDKGQSITFTRDAETSFNPSTGVITPDTATTYAAYGAAFNYSSNELANSNIESGDIRLLVEPETEPQIADTCVVDSVTYRVMDVRKQKPAGTVLYYELQLRV